MTISYIVLSFLVLIQSILFYSPNTREFSILSFLTLIVLIPETDSIAISYSGILYYYYFPVLTFPYLVRHINRKKQFTILNALVLFVLIYSIYGYNSNHQASFILKDIYALFLIVYFYFFFRDQNIKISTDKIKWLFSILFLGLLFIIILRLAGNDLVYSHSVGYFIALFIFLISTDLGKWNQVIYLLLSIIAIILIGNRTIFAIVLVLIIKQSFKFGLKGVFIASLPILIWYIAPYLFSKDITSIIDLEYVQSYLFENRFIPFFSKLEEFVTVSDFVFGKGLGTDFYIPWFQGGQFGHYNLYSPTIDNLYFTLYAKFGVIASYIIYIIFKIPQINLRKYQLNKDRFIVNYSIFIAIYLITTTLIYQSMFIPFFFTLYILNQIRFKQIYGENCTCNTNASTLQNFFLRRIGSN